METVTLNKDVFKVMEEWAPKSLAYEWDNVGLQVGSQTSKVKKVMVTLDVLESVVDEAIKNKVDLIIAHHPLLFKPMKQVNFDSSKGRIIKKLIQHDISVYAAHTNLDAAEGGVNDILCHQLGIGETKVLLNDFAEELVKISVFVPHTHKEDVRNALSENGAGHIGNYSHCTFQSNGQGTFMPLEGTDPYIGNQNELEIVDEVKIETIISKSKLRNAIDAMVEAHPYEEAAYDLFPLDNQGKSFGVGRIGELREKMSLELFCEHVKANLKIPALRVTGDLTKQVKKVAVLGGSGEKYIHKAKQAGADVYITGDMSFHVAQDAWEMGLHVIDPGHHVEKVMIQATKEYLEASLSKDVEIIASQSNTEPFQFV